MKIRRVVFGEELRRGSAGGRRRRESERVRRRGRPAGRLIDAVEIDVRDRRDPGHRLDRPADRAAKRECRCNPVTKRLRRRLRDRRIIGWIGVEKSPVLALDLNIKPHEALQRIRGEAGPSAVRVQSFDRQLELVKPLIIERCPHFAARDMGRHARRERRPLVDGPAEAGERREAWRRRHLSSPRFLRICAARAAIHFWKSC